MPGKFYSKGKLLLTSEYVVLHGAKALALSLRKGQSLTCIKKNEQGVLQWKAFYEGKAWFEASLHLPDLSIIQSTSEKKARKLIRILETCVDFNPGFLDELYTWDVNTDLEFHPEWGFGSSSTLISLLAQWSDVDPMQIHKLVSKGSGYDIACAIADSALTYQLSKGKPIVKTIQFNPPFADQLWFIYLGKKQQSEESVSSFLTNSQTEELDLSFFSSLTDNIINAQTMDEFGDLLDTHEQQISRLISISPLAERFRDLDGYVKSLGAWGGDFALLASNRDETYVRSYLKSKQINTCFSFKELAC